MSRYMTRFGLSVVVVSWLFSASAAVAQTPKEADMLFEQGRKKLEEADALFAQAKKETNPQLAADKKVEAEKKATEACEKFGDAIKLDPTAAGTMLNLGLCNEKLTKFKTALYWFRKAQFRATETKLPDHEKAAREHTTDLATKVATVTIAFSEPPPPNAKVKIDGEEIKPDDYGHAEVDPGSHVLDAGAPGKKIVHEEFTVEGKGGQTMTIAFVAGENSIIVDRGRGRRRTALYLAIGGGVLWGASAVVSGWAKSKYNSANAIFVITQSPEDASKVNHYKDIARYYGTGLFVAGAVAIGVGAMLYFTAPQRERVDQTVFVPTIGPDQLGFAASGSF